MLNLSNSVYFDKQGTVAFLFFLVLRHRRGSILFPYTTLFRFKTAGDGASNIDVTFVNTGTVAGDSGALALGRSASTNASSTTTALHGTHGLALEGAWQVHAAVTAGRLSFKDGVQQVDGAVSAG